MNVLVTGGAGFIGSYVVDELLQRDHHVRVLDALIEQVHPERKRPDYLDQRAELIVGEVQDAAAMHRALAGVEAVIHLAASVGVGQSMYRIADYCASNVMGTAVLLQSVLDTRTSLRSLVVASSMSCYGEGAYVSNEGGKAFPELRSETQLRASDWEIRVENGQSLHPVPTDESKPLMPRSVYAVSKRDQEELCLSVGIAYGIPTTALRFFNTYGPRQALSNPYTGVAAIFCARLLNDRPPLLFEDGKQMRDFVHVEDVARAVVAACERPASGEALNVA
jgi:dTDP-L-rhamnose 4-epimerase